MSIRWTTVCKAASKRGAMIIGLLLLLFGATTAASAGELGGEAWLLSKSVKQGAVAIGRAVYRVNDSTTLRGIRGEPLSLSGLSVQDYEALGEVRGRPTFWVRFDASRSGDALVLNWLELVDVADDSGQSNARRKR